ncbi:MAG: rhodanese-like domain-containing protein, partial [Verrucomicrobiota bacterium]
MISPTELNQRIGSDGDLQLIDARLADDFAAAHLPGATNNCVFEVSFVDRMLASDISSDARVVLYGANGASQEAAMAAEKLSRLDYVDVSVLTGGLQAWEEAGFSLHRGESLPQVPELVDGDHSIDLEASRVVWTGRNLLNSHTGTIGIESGSLRFSSGML